MPAPGRNLLDYTYDSDLLVARYERPDGDYDFATFHIPEGTLPALVAALLVHADQNQRTDILRTEVAANDAIVRARHTAIARHRPALDWLPSPLRDGETLR